MIHAVTVKNPIGDELRMELPNPESSGFLVAGIDGLGPPKASINTSSGASLDGVFYNSARTEARNIVMSLVMVPSPTIEDSRLLSYRFFPIKGEVTLTVETDRRVGEIKGYVESNEPSIFSQQESTQISVLCPDPWFVDLSRPTGSQAAFYGVEPQFEFAFSNESLTERLIQMGEHVNIITRNIEYEGDVETGVLFSIEMRGSVNTPVIYNTATGNAITINTTFINGDVVIINTRRGEKSLYRIRNGVYLNLLNYLGTNTEWLTLKKGSNPLAISATTGGNNMRVYLEYRQLFEGV